MRRVYQQTGGPPGAGGMPGMPGGGMPGGAGASAPEENVDDLD